MTKRSKELPSRSLKGLFIIQTILILGLLYSCNRDTSTVKHIDNVASIIAAPREHIKIATKSSAEVASYTKRELSCLAQNIFFEARGTNLEEKIRVANVTLNRVKSPKYSDNVCSVVFEPYQFSWTLKKHNLKAIINSNKAEKKAWKDSIEVARAQLDNRLPDLTKGAMFYHTHAVSPKWSKYFKKTVKSPWHQYYAMNNK